MSKTWLRMLRLEPEQALQPNQPKICHWTWLRMLRLVAMVMVVMMKRSKDYLPRSQADLQGILPLYALKKGTIKKATK